MKQSFTVGLAILLTGAASLRGQSTTVDLTKQGRIEKGAQLAAHCAVGQLYIYTPAPEGANLYLCSATDVWSSIGGAPLGGDAAGAPSNATVRGIQGRPVDPAAPADRDVLRWDAAAGKWMPVAESPYSAGAGVAIAGSTIAVEDAVVPVYYAGAGAPTIPCVPGRDFYVDSTAGALYFCKGGAAGWQVVSLPGHVHSAGDIGSGTLAAGRLPSSVVLNAQANEFGAGQRQSVGHDSIAAGLRLTPAPGDPASPQDGDVWYNSTTGKFRRWQNGMAMDWDSADAPSGVLLDQANTYTDGMRQSVSHDAANAGLRIVPATGDPAGAQDGDLWYNLTTGKFRRRQSGVAMDWDVAGGASAVLLDHANTYSGGMRQSVSHDAANAGLRIVPATGDPAGAQDGDLWYNLTTGKFRRRQSGANTDWDNGGSGKSFNPHDVSSFWLVEDFTFRGAWNALNYGQYGWYNEPIVAGGCGAGGYQNGLANHPSLALLVTSTGTNTGCSAQLDGGNLQTYFHSLAAVIWEARWTIVPDATYLASNFILRSGLGNTTHNPAAQNAIQVRIDPAASGNIQYDLITAGASTATLDSTLAYDTSATSYTFRLRGDGSKFYFSVSKSGAAFSTEKTLCPSGCDMTAALPTFNTTPFLSIVHGPTADSTMKRAYLDRFSFDLSGLSR